MELTPAIAAILGGLAGAAVTGTFTLISQWLIRRSDDRRQLIDLCFRTGLANWERDVQTATEQAKLNGRSTAVAPLDLYVIHMLSVAKLTSLPEDEMLVEWHRVREETRLAFEQAKKGE